MPARSAIILFETYSIQFYCPQGAVEKRHSERLLHPPSQERLCDMRFATITVLSALGASLAAALPTELTEFFLVTSDQSNPSANSSQLRGVHATTPYVRRFSSLSQNHV